MIERNKKNNNSSVVYEGKKKTCSKKNFKCKKNN